MRAKEDLDSLLGDVEAEVRGIPPVAAAGSIDGDVPGEGEQGAKKKESLLPLRKAFQTFLLGLPLMFQKVSPSLPLKTRRTRKTPLVGKEIMCLLLFVGFALCFFPHRGWDEMILFSCF
ncbi:UNVERIFIED_CONTAM: hypothetical protein Slati_2225900 [Sesamum latifolium]|uniref:Uncharacterized protein n=1 Tax=Sesamum latifolium TaxID=2727402 RepID=A0AAW2WT48_9LAMI